jgi:hypothetical protein
MQATTTAFRKGKLTNEDYRTQNETKQRETSEGVL